MSGELTPQHGDRSRERAAMTLDLGFLASALIWLLLGTALALIASIKLHNPGFLGTSGWLTLGRVQPAHVNVMLYGWASMAGIAVLLGLAGRLSDNSPRFPLLRTAALLLWNLAVAVGTVGILAGDRTGIPWLDFPARASTLIAIASTLVSISAAASLLDREGGLGVPGWYALAASCGFPWLYITAAWLNLWRPVGGVAQVVTAVWYTDGLLHLWFGAISLAILYAMLPKLSGRLIASRQLATLGFWLLVILGVWTGGRRLVGGPLPAWVVTVSIVAGVLLLIHFAAVALNLIPLLTTRARSLANEHEPAFGFLAFATLAYVASGVLEGLGSLRSVSRITHLTHAEIALTHLMLIGSFSMAIFGAVYLILPSLPNFCRPSRRLIRVHFWCSATGLLISWAILTAGGVVQGLALDDPQVSFVNIVRRITPFLMGRSVAGVLTALGNLLFAGIVISQLGRRRRRAAARVGDAADHDTREGPGAEPALAAEREGEP